MPEVIIGRDGRASSWEPVEQHRELSGVELDDVILNARESAVLEGLAWSDLNVDTVFALGGVGGAVLTLRGCRFERIRCDRMEFGALVLEDCVLDSVQARQWDLEHTVMRDCRVSGRVTSATRWFAEGSEAVGNDFSGFDFGGNLSLKFGMSVWDNTLPKGCVLVADRAPVIPRALEILRSQWEPSKGRDWCEKELLLRVDEAELGQQEMVLAPPRRRGLPWDEFCQVVLRACADTGVAAKS